jgi:hypothetical protein
MESMISIFVRPMVVLLFFPPVAMISLGQDDRPFPASGLDFVYAVQYYPPDVPFRLVALKISV